MREVAETLRVRTPDDWGIEPVPVGRRRLRLWDFAILWGDLAVSLLVIVAGSLLVPALGTVEAIVAIVIGNAIGAALLALAGIVGSDTGVPTMVALRPSLGLRGSYLASAFNILQLVGWAALEIIVMASVASGLSEHYFNFSGYYFWLIAFGVVATLMAFGGPVAVVRQWMQKFGVWVVILASLWLTWRLFDAYDMHAIWDRPGDPEAPWPSFWQGIDLVIALPISWLPLVADYSRFGRRSARAALGTYVGYAIANIWFFALGALYVQALQTDAGGLITGDALVQMLVPLTLGWLALVALLAGETDEAFANIYSTAVSLRNLVPRVPHAVLAVLVGAVSVVVAIALDLVQYESFLLLIGGVFVPIFGIFIADYFLFREREYEVPQLFAPAGRYWYTGGVNPLGVVIWLLGFAVYALAAQPPWLLANFDVVSWAPEAAGFVDDLGGTVPSFVFSLLFYWAGASLLRGRLGMRIPAAAPAPASRPGA